MTAVAEAVWPPALSPGLKTPGYASEVPPGLRTTVREASYVLNPGGVSFQ